MYEWLVKTQAWEWIFSGTGVVVVAWLIKVLANKRKQRKTTAPPVGNNADEIRVGKTVHIEGEIVQGPNIAENIGIINQYFGKDDPSKTKALRTAYLNRVLEETGMLPVQGIDPKAASCDTGNADNTGLNLGAVYTALLTRSSEFAENRMVAPENPDKQNLSALAVLNKHQRVVLLGDPGSGKTTFVNFLAMCMSGEGLGRKDANLGLLTSPLPDDNGNDGEKPQPWGHGFLLPVRVVLRDFAARGLPKADQNATADDLWRFILKELEHAALKEFAESLYHELHETGGLLMLDGLDEVPEAAGRRVQIKQVAESFIQTFHKCRVLVTSRTYAYQKQDWRPDIKLAGLEEAVLAPFSDGQIRRFVDRWYAHMAEIRKTNREDSQGRAELLKQAIFHSRNLRELAERPILLTLMASLHSWRGGNLPEKREELYSDTVDLLLDRWESPKVVRESDGGRGIVQPSLIEWLKTDRTKMRRMLNELAHNAHSGQKELAGTADISESDLVAGLMRLTDNPEVKPRQLIEYLSHRAGLLVPRGVRVYSFPHRTFQEYLTACYLTDAGFPKKVAELCRTDPNKWREACLLAGAKAARGSAFAVWSLVEHLCPLEPDDPKAGTADVWGAHIAAQALGETGVLGEIDGPDLQKADRVKRWLVKIIEKNLLPAVERVNAGNSLSRLGDPRFDPEKFFLPQGKHLGFVRIPAGIFLMGREKYDDEKPQHSVFLPEYWIAKYPVTVSQYKAFLRDVGKEPDGAWKRDNEYDNHPVVTVSWHDAMAYSEWLSGKLGKKITLATEAQWEKAARGQDGRTYPWGEGADADRMNFVKTGIGTSAVGCFPKGESPYGMVDMGGNVWEWTHSVWGKSFEKPDYGYPYDPDDGREDESSGSLRVLRGSLSGTVAIRRQSAIRFRHRPVGRRIGCGFRLVLLPGQQ